MLLPSRLNRIKEYRLTGAPAGLHPPGFGICLMGGGVKAPEALRWFADKAGFGDLVILSARDHEDELDNPESTTNAFGRLGCLRSVTTLIVDSRDKADDPFVEARLRRASGIFLPGGDQTACLRLWASTRAAVALQDRIEARDLPIGGSSAGMHCLGRLVHAPEGTGSVRSSDALQDPYLVPVDESQEAGITFQDAFLNIPYLEHVLTDTHWSERDRMGRSVVFLARILQDGLRSLAETRLIACDEGVAVCVDGSGRGRVFAADTCRTGSAFFIRPNSHPDICRPGAPLTWCSASGALTVQQAPADHLGTCTFDLATWEGTGLRGLRINVRRGQIVVSETRPPG